MGQRHSRILTATLLAVSFAGPVIAAPVPVELDPDTAQQTDASSGVNTFLVESISACQGLSGTACTTDLDPAAVMVFPPAGLSFDAGGNSQAAFHAEPPSPLASVMARPALSLLLVPIVLLTLWWSVGRRE